MKETRTMRITEKDSKRTRESEREEGGFLIDSWLFLKRNKRLLPTLPIRPAGGESLYWQTLLLLLLLPPPPPWRFLITCARLCDGGAKRNWAAAWFHLGTLFLFCNKLQQRYSSHVRPCIHPSSCADVKPRRIFSGYMSNSCSVCDSGRGLIPAGVFTCYRPTVHLCRIHRIQLALNPPPPPPRFIHNLKG